MTRNSRILVGLTGETYKQVGGKTTVVTAAVGLKLSVADTLFPSP